MLRCHAGGPLVRLNLGAALDCCVAAELYMTTLVLLFFFFSFLFAPPDAAAICPYSLLCSVVLLLFTSLIAPQQRPYNIINELLEMMDEFQRSIFIEMYGILFTYQPKASIYTLQKDVKGYFKK